MKKLTLIADVLLISLSAGLFLPNSTINMAKYQSDNNMSLITEKDNIIPGEVMDNQIPDKLYDVGNEDQWYISQAVRRAVDKEEADNIFFSELYTRTKMVLRAIGSAGVTGRILDSEELAELLYVAYNRDDANLLPFSKGIQTQYDSLYTTGKDVLKKKAELIDEKINEIING